MNSKKIMLMILILIFSFSGLSFAGSCGFRFDTCSNELGLSDLKNPYIFIIVMPEQGDIARKYVKGQEPVDVLIVGNSQGGLSFMEITPSGGIITTTVDMHGDAVYSRNIIIQGKLIPNQCYGKCLCKE